ncbi:oligosaccharide flippase family protein [Limosilactobacillus reuteri]|nr:oligosaccharide flippase family protein [Limosilactobacillus reuteri]
MKKKSLAVNAILNALRNGLNILFPLITFPYVSRILNVSGLGKYNFSNSIVSYFLLIAGLGINTYAIREGAKFRDDRKK